ncbi:MAG: hypothetical protein ONA90_02030 [candidate division KSB1 bacterium]|nr:hypothetical protein [candidate division KSB1 bacterium]
MEFDLAGIRRSPEFSPNHINNDWTILKLTAEEFTRLGYSVQLLDEEEIGAAPPQSPVIFNMCQGAAANHILQEIENAGRLIINQPGGVLNCHRHNLVALLQQAQIPFPQSFIVDTGKTGSIPDAALVLDRLWIKRGDVHATRPGDVVLVDARREQIAPVLAGFHQRGIAQAILQEHLEGPTIKFYAVQHDGFFRWYHLNGEPPARLDEQALYHIAEAASEALGLQIYGGDAIATPDGRLMIIDVNDWPSYARFSETAAKYIARHIIKKAKEHGKL